MAKHNSTSPDRVAIKSKHVQVTDEFRARILNGELKPGERLPSYNEFRTLHGIHTNTMEKVYAKLESEGLIQRRNGSGTFVSQLSKATRSTQGVIGLAGECFSFNGFSSYWAQIMGGVRDAASQAGLQLLILDPKSHVGWEKADGVLVCDWNDPAAFIKRPSNVPLVSILEPIEGMASVVVDDEAGMRQATEILIEMGHRRISYMHGYHGKVIWNRLAGYRGALLAAGIEAPEAWTRSLHGHYDIGASFTTEAHRIISQWLREGWSTLGCTALLCHNDEAALGAIQALTENGIRVPEDVSVMGFDGTEYCDLVSPKLYSVELPLREVGAVGVELLLKQIEADQIIPEHRVLPVRLREGESIAAPSLHL